MFALHRGATLLCAAAVVGCSPDSRSDVLGPSDVLTPSQLATSAAEVPVHNFSVRSRVIVNAVNTTNLEHEASFTQDGHTMYFNCTGRRADDGGGDICVSRLIGNFEDGRWTEPEVVPAISTQFREAEPKISRNGKRLFFQSNRPGGFG